VYFERLIPRPFIPHAGALILPDPFFPTLQRINYNTYPPFSSQRLTPVFPYNTSRRKLSFSSCIILSLIFLDLTPLENGFFLPYPHSLELPPFPGLHIRERFTGFLFKAKPTPLFICASCPFFQGSIERYPLI